jgi:hypothetical protein
MTYKIIIISQDYPNYGGFGTYAYNFHSELQSRYGLDAVALIYINDTVHADYADRINPNGRSGVYSVLIPKMHKVLDGTGLHTDNINIPNKLLKTELVISLTPYAMCFGADLIESKCHLHRSGHMDIAC